MTVGYVFIPRLMQKKLKKLWIDFDKLKKSVTSKNAGETLDKLT